jgi:hypothetical protein
MSLLTPPEHERNETVVQAAQWLADRNPAPTPIISLLRERFGLSALEATEACALSNKYRVWRKAHG